MWEADSKPSPPSGGGSGGGNTPRPEPEPEPVYTVTFDLNGGPDTITPPDSQTVQYQSKVTRPDLTEQGDYRLAGWFRELECINEWNFDNDLMGGADMTLYGKWEQVKFHISFIGNGGFSEDGWESWESRTEPNGILAPENIKPDPEWEGYVFTGWWTSQTGGTQVDLATQVFTEDTTLYAQWTIKTYTVTFNGCDAQIPPQTVEHGGHATRPDPDPVREGYVFDNWYGSTSWGTPIDFDTYTVLSNVWLEAKFDLGEYTVTFDLNGGPDTVTPPDSQTVSYQYKVPPPSLTEPDGYRLLGWFREKECINEWNFGTDTMGGADMTLYAKWEAIYTVTIDPNGGNWGGSTALRSVTTGQGGKLDPADIPATPTRAGYVFVDWYNTEGYLVSLDGTFTKDTTVRAQWAVEYTITLNPNSGTWADGTTGAKTFKTDRFGRLPARFQI